VPRGARVEAWRATINALNGDGSNWPGLADALRTLARDAGITDGRLTVALMPPLAEARAVDLPRVGDRELQQLLARGAGKYFVAARGAQVVGAVTPPSGAADAAPTVAAAAGARLVNAIHEAATAAGWTVESVVPAEAAWAAAAAQWAGRSRPTAQLVVAHNDRTDLLRVDRGRLVGLRRFRAGTADADLIADAFTSRAGQLAVVGASLTRRELARVLSSRGVSVEAPPAASTDFAEQPDLLAAAFATPAAQPALVTDAVRAARAMATRRLAMRFFVAAGLFVLVGLAFAVLDVRRELTAVKAERATLKPLIASTLVGRTTVENAFRQLQALATEERSAAHWSAIIAGITDHLPEDAYLTGFRGRGDSVSVEGLSSHASRVFGELAKDKALTGVHGVGTVRIENPPDGPPMERFAVSGQLVHPGAPKTPSPNPAGPQKGATQKAPARGGAK